MTEDLILAEIVATWAREVLPNDASADRAVAVAMRCYSGGASVAEACEEARGFVQSWIRHPSNRFAELAHSALLVS